MSMIELRAAYQALEESHDELLSEKVLADEGLSSCRVDVKDMASQVREYKDERDELETQLEAMKGKCLQFAESYLDTTTRLKAAEGAYREMLKVWQDKLKEAECTNEGLDATIFEQRESIIRKVQRIRELRAGLLVASGSTAGPTEGSGAGKAGEEGRDPKRQCK